MEALPSQADNAASRKARSHDRRVSAKGRRLLARLRPPRTIKLTGSGKLAIALTLGLGLAAVNSGNNLLYLLLAFLLSAIVLSGILSELGLRRLKVAFEAPARLFAAESTPARVRVNSPGRLATLDLTVRLSWQQGASGVAATHVWLLQLGPHSERVLQLPVTPNERGALRFLSVECISGFPFGLFAKCARFPLGQPALVFPARRLKGVRLRQHLQRQTTGARAAQLGSPGSEDWRELRGYRRGDALATVAWKASAHQGRWVVIERDASPLPLCVFEVDALARGDAFEEALMRASTLLDAAVKAGVAFEVRVLGAQRPHRLLRFEPGSPLGSQTPDRLWRALAKLESRAL